MASVWYALFMREAVARLMSGRLAGVWLLVEPLAHTLFLALLFGFVFARTLPGVDYVLFVMVGLMAWKLFQATMNRSMNAVSANQALFSFRQVKPVDAVLVRCGLEGFLEVIVFGVLIVLMAFVGKDLVPSDPPRVLLVGTLLWLLGAGFGLMFSVMVTLLPDSDKLLGIVLQPLYFMSGIMYSMQVVPEPYRSWLLLNPVANGIELLRAAYFPGFHAASGASLGYLSFWVLCTLALGLALHVRYERRLVMLT